MSSNMRQRNAKGGGTTPTNHHREQSSHRSSSFSDHTSNRVLWAEESENDLSENNNAGIQPVPLYHAIHYPSPPPALGSPATAGGAGSGSPQKWQQQYQSSSNINHNDGYNHNYFKTNPTTGVGTYKYLRDQHSLPGLVPSIIPDKQYESYLLTGQPFQFKSSKPWIDKILVAKVLAGFSWVGVLFLLWAGILMDRQPMFLPGVLTPQIDDSANQRKAVIFYLTSPDERLPQASHAYQAAILYFITGCLCSAYASNRFPHSLHHWWMIHVQRYDDIPDHANHDHENGHGELPTTTSSARPPAAYHYGSATNRARVFLASLWPIRNYQERHRARRRYAGPKEV